MVGAPDHSIFVQAADLLEKMGKNVMYCGPVGTGQVFCTMSFFFHHTLNSAFNKIVILLLFLFYFTVR